MLLNIEKLLISPTIIELQKKEELIVKGYANLGVKGDKKEFLTRIIFSDNKDNTYVTPLIQPEILTFFPLKSKLYNGKVFPNTGEIKEIEIDFNEVKYNKFKKIEDVYLKSILANEFEFNLYTYYGIYKNVCIPSLVIGNYFYFQTTAIRRIFRNNSIDTITHLVDCQNGDVVLKNNVKYNDITAIFTYLFHCNNNISSAFRGAYNFNIDYTIQNEKKYSDTKFQFPKLGKQKITVRGIERDGYFIVYEILNFDFSTIIDIDEIRVSYKGKQQVKVFKTNSFTTKVPTNKSNISQENSYGKYLETNLELLEIDSEVVKNTLKVRKVEPITFQEYFSAVNKFYENSKNNGLTLGNFKDNSSKFAKSALSIESKSLYDIRKKLEQLLDAIILKTENSIDYSYLYFSLDDVQREYLLIKLKRENTAWYLLSTNNPPLATDILAYHLLNIKDNPNHKYKNNNEFSRDIFEKYGVCFHKSLKGVAENFDEWINRLVNRIYDWNECKGIKFDKRIKNGTNIKNY